MSNAVKQSIKDLSENRKSITCGVLIEMLKGLGFKVRKGKRGNHHIVTHASLDWHGSDFNCPDKASDAVLAPYISKVKSFLRELEDQLMELEKKP